MNKIINKIKINTTTVVANFQLSSQSHVARVLFTKKNNYV